MDIDNFAFKTRFALGLGVDPGAVALDIRWPSGVKQHIDGVKVDQMVKIDEAAK